MSKLRRKFVLYAEIAVFVLLTVLLTIINAISFTMAADDADMLTEAIARSNGMLVRENKTGTQPSGTQQDRYNYGGGFQDRIGRMGPFSPEMNFSVRYFTFAFDKDGNGQLVDMRMAAVTQEEAESWARSLLQEHRGWSNVTYRYRVYELDEKTYVTVIDQGRELVTAYRILVISVCGECLFLLISFLVLMAVGKQLFKKFEEADRKQQQFIANIENDFKMPLTIINANAEVIEKESGTNENTQSINRQVKKMTKLVKNLSVLAFFNEKDIRPSEVDLSILLSEAIDRKKPKLDQSGIVVETDIETDITLRGDEEGMRRMLDELMDNALKFAEGKVQFILKKSQDRIKLIQKNPTSLANGSIDQIFDRFTVLDNATGEKSGAGLGLSYVKDVVKAHNGRAGAKVVNGEFILTIDL